MLPDDDYLITLSDSILCPHLSRGLSNGPESGHPLEKGGFITSETRAVLRGMAYSSVLPIEPAS